MDTIVRPRRFMFLQGPAGPFFAQLGDMLMRAGCSTTRVNFCGGDWIFWPSRDRRNVLNFRGGGEQWPAFLKAQMQARAITDIVVFGDCRSAHRAAALVAEELGATFWSFEEGYLRPDWITLEAGGNNARSALIRNPQDILARASAVSETPKPMPVSKGTLINLALNQIAYEVANILMRPAFPTYRSHRPTTIRLELSGWFRRLSSWPMRRISARHLVEQIRDGRFGPYFLLPLQLDTDYQLREHSPYGSMREVVREVIASFATHAPPESKLLLKKHPLHNGTPNLRREAMSFAEVFGVCDRVVVIDGGHLPTLLMNSDGIITVNSTVGLSALHHLRPVKVLGSAIYDIPGLTFQGNLDVFWRERKGPNPALISAFRRVVTHDTQINGNFHTKAGRRLGVEGAMSRLLKSPPDEYCRVVPFSKFTKLLSKNSHSLPSAPAPLPCRYDVALQQTPAFPSANYTAQPRSLSKAGSPSRAGNASHNRIDVNGQ